MIIYLLYKNSCLYETDREVAMQKQVEKKKYYVVRERAVPEVLLKVVEAKRLLESNRVATVQEAAEKTGISRSSFYKYKDDIFPFHHHLYHSDGRRAGTFINGAADDCPFSR